MNEIQEKLINFAKNQALPYLNSKYKDYIDKLSFVLVGSAATGLCGPASDADIAMVCSSELYDKLSEGTRWGIGKPTEVILGGIMLQYYAISFELIKEKFNELDDLYLHVYNNCIILQDPDDQYANSIPITGLNSAKLKKKRVEGKLDMLLRRSRVLNNCIKSGADILLSAEIYVEIIKRILKVTALLDDIDFDPRKRIYKTTLAGITGEKINDKIEYLFKEISLLAGAKEDNFKSALP